MFKIPRKITEESHLVEVIFSQHLVSGRGEPIVNNRPSCGLRRDKSDQLITLNVVCNNTIRKIDAAEIVEVSSLAKEFGLVGVLDLS
jgi:hypothetical protein